MAEPARGVVGQLTVNGVRVGGVLSFGVNGPPAGTAGKNGKPPFEVYTARATAVLPAGTKR